MPNTPTPVLYMLPEGHVVIDGVEYELRRATVDSDQNHDSDARYTVSHRVPGKWYSEVFLADGRDYTVDDKKRVVRPEKPLFFLKEVDHG